MFVGRKHATLILYIFKQESFCHEEFDSKRFKKQNLFLILHKKN